MGHDDGKILLLKKMEKERLMEGDDEEDTSIVPRLNTHSIPQWKEVLSVALITP